MNFDNKTKAKKKETFLKSTAELMQTKSFFDKHYLTTSLASGLSYTLSLISIALGVTAIFTLFKLFFGLNDGLLVAFDNQPILAYSLAFSALAFLAFIEFAKHHFHTEALTEKYRDTDDRGRLETRIALIAQILSMGLSVWGGVIVANELAGTQKAKTLAAIQAEYEPKIASSSADQTSYFDAKSWKGKLSDNNIGEHNRLTQVKTDLEAAYLTAKEEAGVTSFVVTDAAATFNMAALLGGSQVLVEIMLFGCLWWSVYFKARVFDEETPTLSIKKKVKKEVKNEAEKVDEDVFYESSINQTPAYNETKRIEVKGFGNRNNIENNTPNLSHNTEQNTEHNTAQNTTQNAQNVVPQQSHTKPTHTNTVLDLEKEKKRVRQYIPRIHEDYTQIRFERLKADIPTLAKHGFKVTIEKDFKAEIKKSIPINSTVIVNWESDGLKIIYTK